MLLKTSLGQKTIYPSIYNAGLLLALARAPNRIQLGIQGNLPFQGVDLWNAYEIAWLNLKGKPMVALGEFVFNCTSVCMLESKAFKLYLNSFNQTCFSSVEVVRNILQADLTRAAQGPVKVTLRAVEQAIAIKSLPGLCLDSLDIEVDEYMPNPKLLLTAAPTVHEKLCSHLLKSNCPVTGQPDWASVFIEYWGPQINHSGLLKYIISLRQHPGFHELCVERMFIDILRLCQPTQLTVYARYTRRGGLDINPFRSNFAVPPANLRNSRQ